MEGSKFLDKMARFFLPRVAFLALVIALIIGLYMLMPKVKALLADYQERLASGEFKKVR